MSVRRNTTPASSCAMLHVVTRCTSRHHKRTGTLPRHGITTCQDDVGDHNPAPSRVMAARALQVRVLPPVGKHCRPDGGGTRDAGWIRGMNLRDATSAAAHIT